MPKRIQMSRQRPWRAEHPDAVIVDRRTKWGNPWAVVAVGPSEWQVKIAGESASVLTYPTKSEAARVAVAFFRLDLEVSSRPWVRDQSLEELRGRDLACWCPLDQPCHADVLLELANQ